MRGQTTLLEELLLEGVEAEAPVCHQGDVVVDLTRGMLLKEDRHEEKHERLVPATLKSCQDT